MLGGVATGLASTAGCLGVLTGDEPLEYESDPATVPSAVLDSTGYELANEEAPTVSREFTVAGQTREVKVTNHVVSYEKAVDMGPLGSLRAAMFSAFTTPQIQIAGKTLSPIGEMSNRDLLRTIASRYEGLSVGEKVGSQSVSTLDQTVTVERYEGTITVQDQEVPIYLLFSRFQHGDDYVVPVGGYPQQRTAEESNIYTLIERLEH
ncbi:hypothetical protein HLASF_0393 [Halanaeroarchaeum sulfurireducens]|uniref:AMMECR1 domain-containing protein n=1 Tax=Halanaeroarchaeum sulfurireducens TaxID=1604004 RepID=A0A0F7PB85_9EURY|nr:hypothetical protein HLASF_0393 [Halanaeroarchaeum sulfurireducens]ALG81301.1 hypothetical protein HLASA_0392 [Halanaeroarchaeum sulfurireducens]